MRLKNFIIIFGLILFTSSNAYSACKHILKFGKKFTPKLVKEYGERPEGISDMYFEANEICPGQNLNGIVIKYTFLDNVLANIHMFAFNEPGNNKATEKLTLMKYAKKVYGDFDTGADPKIYNHYNIWQKKKRYIIYRRLKTQKNLWTEDLTISTAKFDQTINALINEDGVQVMNNEEQN
jgi:hypothetical protein